MQNYLTNGHGMKSNFYHGFGGDDEYFDSEVNTESSFERSVKDNLQVNHTSVKEIKHIKPHFKQKTFKDDMVRWDSLPRNVFTEMIQKNCQEMLKYRSTAKVSRTFWNSLCLNPIFDRICIKINSIIESMIYLCLNTSLASSNGLLVDFVFSSNNWPNETLFKLYTTTHTATMVLIWLIIQDNSREVWKNLRHNEQFYVYANYDYKSLADLLRPTSIPPIKEENGKRLIPLHDPRIVNKLMYNCHVLRNAPSSLRSAETDQRCIDQLSIQNKEGFMYILKVLKPWWDAECMIMKQGFYMPNAPQSYPEQLTDFADSVHLTELRKQARRLGVYALTRR